jgi:hypothetical protein
MYNFDGQSKYNFDGTQTAQPFENTNLGIAVNTVRGLPQGAIKVGASILGFLDKNRNYFYSNKVYLNVVFI